MKSHHKISSIFFIFLLLISSSGTSSNLILFDFFVPAYAVDGGVISQVISLEHNTINGRHNSLVQVDSDTYTLAYSGSGVITTFTIPTDGSAITEVISLEHNSLQTLFNSLVQVDSDTYALAYTGTSNDGFIKTFTINPTTGAITEVATEEHDTADGTYNSLIKVDSDTYALAYAGDSNDGFIKTFTISESVVETETTVAASVSSSDKSESSQYKEEKMLRTPDESFYFEEADYSEIASESLAVPINSAVIEPVIETFETVSAPEKVEATPEDT